MKSVGKVYNTGGKMKKVIALLKCKGYRFFCRPGREGELRIYDKTIEDSSFSYAGEFDDFGNIHTYRGAPHLKFSGERLERVMDELEL
ncbi:MAG: hypothetical protein WC533_03450 [Candidatus Pacearchaeota archaeon]